MDGLHCKMLEVSLKGCRAANGQETNGEEAALKLDADISPEEMQMMQAMGIPFGFNTTQVMLLGE